MDDDGGGSGDDEMADGGTTPLDDLNLLEANVTDVTLDSQSDGGVWFSVMLYHDDASKDGYAN